MNNPTPTIKSIAPIRPTASNMPSKSVAPLGAPVKKDNLASLRPGGGLPGLPPIGDKKPKDTGSRDIFRSTKTSDKLSAAWNSMTKLMPSTVISRSGSKYNADYVNGFTNYSDFFNGLTADFGAGQKKEYQTTQGKQNLYEYEYQNFLRFGNINGSRTSSEFSFRDGRWWTVQKTAPSYEEMVADKTDPVLSRYSLSADESAALYNLAKSKRLTAEQYQSLYQTATAKKYGQYFTDTSKKLQPFSDALMNNRIMADGAQTISNHAQFGSIFSRGDPGIKFLSEMGSLFDGVQQAMQARADTQFKYAGVFSETNKLQSQLTQGTLGNLGALMQVANLILSGIGAGAAHTGYWLTNNEGKIIDNYADMNSTGNKRGIKAIAREKGLEKNKVAAVLGMLYRYRILKAMQPMINEYNSEVDKNRFSDVKILDFYGG